MAVHQGSVARPEPVGKRSTAVVVVADDLAETLLGAVRLTAEG